MFIFDMYVYVYLHQVGENIIDFALFGNFFRNAKILGDGNFLIYCIIFLRVADWGQNGENITPYNVSNIYSLCLDKYLQTIVMDNLELNENSFRLI